MKSKKINKSGIKATLIIVNLAQLGIMAFSSVVSNITKVFPDVSDQTAQFLMTFPGLFIMITSLLSAILTRYISQKKLAVTGLILNTITAVGGLLFHQSIVFLFCWAITLGLGLGLWMPIITAMASEYFVGDERTSVLGHISSSQNIGAIFMTVIGGLLAALSWYYVYLVYFIALPGLICAIIYLPDQKAEKRKKADAVLSKHKSSLSRLGIDGSVILFSLIQFCFGLPYNAGPANFSLLLAENKIGSTSTAGIISGLFLFGGIISGHLFGALEKRFKKQTITLGCLCLAVSFLGLGTSHSLLLYMIFAVIGGMGLPLTIAQTSLCVVENKKPEQFAMATAVLFAAGNLGAFFSPFTTSLSTIITGSSSISTRMLFCASLALAFGLIAAIILKMRERKNYV